MKREDVPEALAARQGPKLDETPCVSGPDLSQRRIALISTAGLMHRGDKGFSIGAADYRILDTESEQDLMMTHVSTNFDRSGFVQDRNLVLPVDRLAEKAVKGQIGTVARYHYSFMGATGADQMKASAEQLARNLRGDEVDGLILIPV